MPLETSPYTTNPPKIHLCFLSVTSDTHKDCLSENFDLISQWNPKVINYEGKLTSSQNPGAFLSSTLDRKGIVLLTPAGGRRLLNGKRHKEGIYVWRACVSVQYMPACVWACQALCQLSHLPNPKWYDFKQITSELWFPHLLVTKAHRAKSRTMIYKIPNYLWHIKVLQFKISSMTCLL